MQWLLYLLTIVSGVLNPVQSGLTGMLEEGQEHQGGRGGRDRHGRDQPVDRQRAQDGQPLPMPACALDLPL